MQCKGGAAGAKPVRAILRPDSAHIPNPAFGPPAAEPLAGFALALTATRNNHSGMTILDSAKELVALAEKVGRTELYQKICDLRNEIMDQQQRLIEVTDERNKYRDSCKEFEAKLAFQAKLTFKAPFYFAESDGVPFCPTCWESKHAAIHLNNQRLGPKASVYFCQICGAKFPAGASSQGE